MDIKYIEWMCLSDGNDKLKLNSDKENSVLGKYSLFDIFADTRDTVAKDIPQP